MRRNPSKLGLLIHLAPVVQRLDNAIHRINHYPADSMVCFVNIYPRDSDLSGGERYPAFEQLGPEVLVSSDKRHPKNLTF